MIPRGGYIKMLDGRVDDVPAEPQAMAFDKLSHWKRSAIVSAGLIFTSQSQSFPSCWCL